MRKQIITLVLLGLICSVGNVWAEDAVATSAGTYSFGSTNIGGKNKFAELSSNSVFIYRNTTYSTSNSGIKALSGNNSGFVFYLTSPMDLSATIYQNSKTSETVTLHVKTVTSTFFQALVNGTPNSTTVDAPTLTAHGTASQAGPTKSGEFSISYGTTLDAGYYYVYATSSASSVNTSHRSITLATHASTKAPSIPTLSVDGGDVDGGSTTTITSVDAIRIYYCWTASNEAPAQDAPDTWTKASGSSYSFTIPNVTATDMYLHAYGWNTYGPSASKNSETKTSSVFNVAKTKEAAGLFYATSSITKYPGDDNFTNVLSNPNSLTGITYSIEEGATATGVEVDESGEVTIGSVPGTATIKASFAGNEDYYAGSATYTLTIYDGGTSGTVDDLATISSDYTFIAELVTGGSISSGKLYENNHVYSASNSWSEKGSSTIDGKSYKNGINLNNSAYVAFKVSAPCHAIIYAGNNSSRNLQVGTSDVADKFGEAPNGQIAWSCFISEATTVYIKEKTSGDYSLAGFKLFFSKPITITSAGWASYSGAYPLDFTGTGVTAYIAKAKDANTVTLSEITKVPANTGIVVNGSASTHNIPILNDDADDTDGNLLKPWLVAGEPSDETYYTLAAGPKFMKSAGGTLAAGKAYLVMPSGTGAPSEIRIVDEENNATSIDNIDAVEEGIKFIQNGQLYIKKNGVVYDAMGRIIR